MQTCEAKKSSHALDLASTLGLSDQHYNGILSGQSPCVQLGLWWLCSSKNCQEFRRIGQSKLTLARHPILQSHNHKTQNQICPLSLAPVIYGHASDLQAVPYRVQNVQIAAICFNGTCRAFQGWPPAWFKLLLQWPRCGCLRYGACTPACTPLTRHLHQYWSSQPYNTIESCNWPSWPPISDSLYLPWPSPGHRSRGYCLCRHQRSIHKGIHGISQPLAIWGWETPICGHSNEIWPLSNSYWHRQWQHSYHHHKSGKGQPPNQTCKVWSLKGQVKLT